MKPYKQTDLAEGRVRGGHAGLDVLGRRRAPKAEDLDRRRITAVTGIARSTPPSHPQPPDGSTDTAVVALTGAALGDRLGAAIDLELIRSAAHADPPALERLRYAGAIGAQVSDVELRRAASALLISRTTARLERARRTSAPHRDAHAQASPQHGGTLGVLGFRLGVARSAPSEGPEPVLRGPRTADLARARSRLSVLRPGRRLSSADTAVLLEQTAWAVRQAIAGARRSSDRVEDAFTPENIQGACGFGQACSAFHLEDLGISDSKVKLHQAANVFGPSSFRHAFAVAEMPDGKTYLIDCTFRQFFQPKDEGPDRVGEPGRRLRSTRRGRQVSNELLSKGFIELTDEVAQLYGGALAGGPRAFTAADLLESTVEIDYDRDEIVSLPQPPAPRPAPRLRPEDASPKIRGPP